MTVDRIPTGDSASRAGCATWRSRAAIVAALAAMVVAGGAACSTDATDQWTSAPYPWGTNVVMPAALVEELAAADKPVIVCTAPPFLYRVGHIPGAILHGPASSPAGLDSLKAWAQPLPRSTNIVIYCGCCPLRDCPNLHPAYHALKTLGFTRVRVLILPDSFRTDWVDRGYPVTQAAAGEGAPAP